MPLTIALFRGVILVHNNKPDSCASLFFKKSEGEIRLSFESLTNAERIVCCVFTAQLRKMEIHTTKYLIVLMMYILRRYPSEVSYGHDLVSSRGSYSDEWHADLLGCCSEPALCMSINLIFELWKFDYHNFICSV